MTPHFRIPFRMNNGENHHLVLDQPEHHAVWEALEKGAPPILVDDFIAFGRREHAPYRSFRRIEELLAKARPTVRTSAKLPQDLLPPQGGTAGASKTCPDLAKDLFPRDAER